MCTLGIKKQSAWDDSATVNCFCTWKAAFCVIQLKTSSDFYLYSSFFFLFFTMQRYFYTSVFLEKSDWTTSCIKLLGHCVALGTDSCGLALSLKPSVSMKKSRTTNKSARAWPPRCRGPRLRRRVYAHFHAPVQAETLDERTIYR